MNTIKKGKAEGKMFDLVLFEDYMVKDDKIPSNIAVEHNGMIYPARSDNDTRPGVYRNDFGYHLVQPEEYQVDQYIADNETVIDFKSRDLQELLEKSERLKNMEREMLTTVDDLTDPIISPKDRPEMVALKKAISAKRIDIRKYSSRFDGTFQNDIRLLKRNNISMDKLVSFLDILDLDGYLIIDNKEGDEPNPMPEPIKVKLTNSRGEE